MRAHRLVALALLTAVMPMAAAHVAADCGPTPPLEESVAAASTVFIGTVTSTASGRTLATVDVAAVWKGDDLPELIEVRGGYEGDPDPATFNVGGTYIFFPVNRRAPFVADACSGTRLYSGAPLVVPAYLADEAGTTTARLPLVVEDEPSAQSTVLGPVIGAIAGLLVIFGLAGLYFGGLRRLGNRAERDLSRGNGSLSRRQARAIRRGRRQVRGASRTVPAPRRRARRRVD